MKSYLFLLELRDLRVSRKEAYNYTSVYGDNKNISVSGTETAVLNIANELAKVGNKVDVVGYCIKGMDNGILFDDYESMELIKNKSYDILVTYMFDVKKIEGLKNNKITFDKIVSWFHCQYLLTHEIYNLFVFQHNEKIEVEFVVMSEWGKKLLIKNNGMFYTSKNVHVIPYGLDTKNFQLLNLNKKKNSFIFHACLDRGLYYAVSIFNKLKMENKTMDICTYYALANINFEYNKEEIKFHYQKSKKELYEMLRNTEYFIYPLVNKNNGLVHKDTFGLVVMEAIASGVIVIALDAGCLKDVYGDNIFLIKPETYKPETYTEGMSNSDYSVASEEVLDKYIKIIEYLEENPDKKQEHIKKAYEWAMKQDWSERVKLWSVI